MRRKAKDTNGGNHLGFACRTAAESLCLSEKYEKCLKSVENKLKIVTSTPKNIMDVSFLRCFRDVVQGDSSVGLVLDNDSGYVSTNQESNIEYPSVNMSANCGTSNSKPIYLSEDALLEKPEIYQQQTEQEYSHLYFLTDSVVAASCESEKTTFSGLEDNDESGVDKDASSESIIIPVISPVKTRISKTDPHVKTPEKAYKNPMNSDISPDLFSDEDEPAKSVEELNQSLIEKYVHVNDQKLIKRVQQGLSGVYPPPSVTMVHMSVAEMLDKINENKHLFLEDGSCGGSWQKERKSLLITETAETAVVKEWPQVMEPRYHGLLYNRSKFSEDFEQLCIKYAQRFVGAETQSTCTVFESNTGSPSKRKSTKSRWTTRSPGRRLSHLARRRITFNNPVLQNSGSSNAVCSRARQILVDARRLELLSRKKSPRKRASPRKTPRKSPRVKGRTPTSSTKKRLALQFRMYSEEDAIPSTSATSSSFKANITKRALFQSPDREGILTNACASGLSYSKKTTPKRALFSSPKKNSPSKSGSVFDRKRKRPDEEDPQPQTSKLVRSVSTDIIHPSSSEQQKPLLLQRRPSECSAASSSRSCDLSAHHKKKLQWAVYEALKSRNVGINHPQFKTFASVLARVTRRFLPNLSANAPRPEGGTSEKMLKIARQHVHAVITGKSVDEIVLEVELNKNRTRRPAGYVGLEDTTNKVDVSHARSDKENQKVNVLCEKNVNDENVKPKLLRAENKIDRIRKVIDFGDDTESSGILR